MARLSITKTNFTAGEISPHLLGRGDLRSYENGASKLTNVFIHPTGGVVRRSGLRYLDTVPGKGRLVAFEFNVEQVYLLVFTDFRVDVYREGVWVAGFIAPWSAAQVCGLNWTQTADTLLVVHPDVAPRKITRTSNTAWTLDDWLFFEKDNRLHQPYHKFAPDGVTLTASATTGSITINASAAVFDVAHVGTRFRLQNKDVEITAVVSAASATATVHEPLVAIAATEDWQEQAFSPVRGWPVSVCFHQDRMVIGGGRDLPNRLWMSRSADLFNFDLGTGLDDEGIEFAILSDQVNAVRAVFSGRHLQVFTSGAEWMVTGDPLSPGNIQLLRQTQIGSPTTHTVPPRNVDGATLFAPRHAGALREFLFADVEQAYQSADLGLLASHMLAPARDQDFDTAARLFHMVMDNGKMATVTIYRAEQVTAWTLQETKGAFWSVAVAGGGVYVLVARAGGYYLEQLEADMNVDGGVLRTSATAKTIWTGLDHLEGETLKVIADGAPVLDAVVSGGTVVLDNPALRVEMGLAFSHVIEPLPPVIDGGSMSHGPVRAIAHVFRLHECVSLRLDTGSGFHDRAFKRFGPGLLDQPPVPFSGDRKVRALGWKRGGDQALWRIEGDAPQNFTLLSVASEIAINR